MSRPLPQAGGRTVLDELFGALADPTRRELFDRLLRTGPQTATTIAAQAGVTISRQAVVKHLQALVEAGLAESTRAGREVRYAATPEPLSAVLAWLMESSPRWDARIERLVARSQEISGAPARARRPTSRT